MKTAITSTLLLITMVMQGQDDNKILATKAYRIEHVSNITNANRDTTDFTDFFTEDDGFIILMHSNNGNDLFSADRGSHETLMFLGRIENRNVLEEKDSLELFSTAMARGGDTLQHAIVKKVYVKNSLEDTGEKIFLFQLVFFDELWDFVTTEVITGKKDI